MYSFVLAATPCNLMVLALFALSVLLIRPPLCPSPVKARVPAQSPQRLRRRTRADAGQPDERHLQDVLLDQQLPRDARHARRVRVQARVWGWRVCQWPGECLDVMRRKDACTSSIPAGSADSGCVAPRCLHQLNACRFREVCSEMPLQTQCLQVLRMIPYVRYIP